MEFKTDLQKVTRIEEANAVPLTPENYLGLRDLFYPEEYGRYAPRTRDIKKWFEFRNGEAWLVFRNPEAWDMIISWHKERSKSLLFDGFPERWAGLGGPYPHSLETSPLDLVDLNEEFITEEFAVRCLLDTICDEQGIPTKEHVLDWGTPARDWMFGSSYRSFPLYYVDIEAYQDISPALIHKL